MRVTLQLGSNQIVHINGIPAKIESIGGVLVSTEAENVPMMFPEPRELTADDRTLAIAWSDAKAGQGR